MKELLTAMLTVTGLTVCAAFAAPDAADSAQAILDAAGVKNGLIVHVGCEDGTLTAALRTMDGCTVQGLATDPAKVEAARRTIKATGLYGKVSVVRFGGKKLPYIDNLVDLVVVSEAKYKVPGEELARVLRPGGVVCIHGSSDKSDLSDMSDLSDGPALPGWIRKRKPVPAEIDDWPQYMHGPDNNAVANDTVVGPPRHMQWVNAPAWSRSHMSIPSIVTVVSTKGRLFSIEDTATTENPFLPGRFALIARAAFNGIELWRHDFPEFEAVTRYVKDQALQLQRRVAAIGDVVYCTPGLNTPVTVFDAATGKILKVLTGTEKTQELVVCDGILYAVIGDRMNAARYNIVKTYSGKGTSYGGSDKDAPFGGTGWKETAAREVPNKTNPKCVITALAADSGKVLWKSGELTGYTACTLSIRGPHAVYQTQQGLFCRDRRTGAETWSVKKTITTGDGTDANPVVLTDKMVYAKEGNTLQAYSIEDGSPKWNTNIANNYEKAADLFVVGNSVWTGGSRQPTQCDAITGKKGITIAQKMTGPMGHDRCYRNFITTRFYINSKTGGADFCSLDGKREYPHPWTRGTCGFGVLPCNGLVYATPYSCQCCIGSQIHNFNAMYTEKGLDRPDRKPPVERKARLIKGPAFGAINHQPSTINHSFWPTYRGDIARSGSTKTPVAATGLKPKWTAKVTTRPSPPVIAGGKVFVADVDAHTVIALKADDGKQVWEYTAGSRVDSPPTYHKGTVLFGSRDGWVHCVRASDGALVWRFRDLPDRIICAFGQLESAWPVSGSVLVLDDTVYFVAGRSSFLDSGIYVYALKADTGELVGSRQVYGPFEQGTGFPSGGSKADILVSNGKQVFMRHVAFKVDLAGSPQTGATHLIPSQGFLDPKPQHRTYWTLASGLRGKTTVPGASGDILAIGEDVYYEVRGFPVHRHSYFDPRVSGYRLMASALNAPRGANIADQDVRRGRSKKAKRGKRGKNSKEARAGAGSGKPSGNRWSIDIPLTGLAMALAGDSLFVAGAPAHFPPDHSPARYEAAFAGKLGGVLWAVSAADGKKLSELKLAALPVWDGIAAAHGDLFISFMDGSIACFAGN